MALINAHSYSALREAFLDSAYAHLAPPGDGDSDSSGEGGRVFSPNDHLGGAARAIPRAFNQFTPMMRRFGAGMWPRPGSQLYHSPIWPGKGEGDLEVLALSPEGLLSGVLLATGTVTRSKHVMDRAWSLIYSRKGCVDCSDDLRVGYQHLLSK